MKALSKFIITLMGIFSINASAEIMSDSLFTGTDSRSLLNDIRPGLRSSTATYGYANHIGKTINMTGNIGNSPLTFADYTEFSVSAKVDSEGVVFLKGACSTRNLSAFNYPYKRAINNEIAVKTNTGTKSILAINNYVNTELLKLPPICEFRISPAGLSVLTKDKGAKVFFNGFAKWPATGETTTTYSKNNTAKAVVVYQ